MKEEFRAVFIGRNTIFIGDMTYDGNNLKVPKRNNFFPMLKKETAVHSNIKNYLKDYEDRTLIDLNDGRTDEKVRVFFFDLDTCEKFEKNHNPDILRQITTLENQRNLLYQQVRELQHLIEVTGNKDLLKGMMKAEYDFYTQDLKPQFSPFPKKDGKGGKK